MVGQISIPVHPSLVSILPNTMPMIAARANSVAVDVSGNIYITDRFFSIMDFYH